MVPEIVVKSVPPEAKRLSSPPAKAVVLPSFSTAATNSVVCALVFSIVMSSPLLSDRSTLPSVVAAAITPVLAVIALIFVTASVTPALDSVNAAVSTLLIFTV